MDLQTEGIEGTVVTFAGGSLHEAALVVLTAEVAGEWLVVTDRSPFHPVSLSWPDQPGDRGWLICGTRRSRVLDSREGLLNQRTGVLSVGDAARALKRSDLDPAACDRGCPYDQGRDSGGRRDLSRSLVAATHRGPPRGTGVEPGRGGLLEQGPSGPR